MPPTSGVVAVKFWFFGRNCKQPDGQRWGVLSLWLVLISFNVEGRSGRPRLSHLNNP